MDTIRWIPGVCFLRLGDIALDAGKAINNESQGWCLSWLAASPFMVVGSLAIYAGRGISGEQEAHLQRHSYIQRIFAK